MKWLMCMILLVGGEALAHVGDSDELSILPKGTQLEVLREVNIKPSHTSTFFVDGREITDFLVLAYALSYCNLQHTSSSQGRRLEPGARLVLGKPEVWERDSNGRPLWVAAKVENSEEITRVDCEIKPHIARLRNLMVSDLKNNLTGAFRAIFPPPSPIKVHPVIQIQEVRVIPKLPEGNYWDSTGDQAKTDPCLKMNKKQENSYWDIDQCLRSIP